MNTWSFTITIITNIPQSSSKRWGWWSGRDNLLLVNIKGERILARSKHPNKYCSGKCTNKTTIKQNPRWHGSLSPVRRMFSGGDICCSGVMRLVNRGFGLFLDIFSTPAPGVHWVGISNFISCHKRDTGCSGELCTPAAATPVPSTSPLARHHTRPWKSWLQRED